MVNSSQMRRSLLLTFVLRHDLRQTEVLTVLVLKVVFLQSPLDHLSSFVLAGQL